MLICGGMTGVMEHAARGARSVGGLTVGLLPGDDPDAANPYIDVSIATDVGQGRNAILARTADGVFAVGGGLGTLSEIALAVRNGRPTVGIHTWQFTLDRMVEPSLPTVETPQAGLDWLFARLA